VKRRLGGLLLAVSLAGCANNPMTGRSQLILLSESQVIAESAQAYRQELAPWTKQGKIDNDHALKARIDDITSRLIAQAIRYRPDTAQWAWQVAVIDDPKTLNAFCLPGGRMAIYSGLTEKLHASDDELAQVMGHEIAHALANHGAEKMSIGLAANVLTGLIGVASGDNGRRNQQVGEIAALLAWQLPNSREAETEADKIGIELAARAGYDPKAAPALWQKMLAAEGGGGRFDWLSTHPASEKRMAYLAALAPQMAPLYLEAKRQPPTRFALAGAGSKAAETPVPDTAQSRFDRFKRGELFLDCTQCGARFDAQAAQMARLYRAHDWPALAALVGETGHARDIAWYYLGAAAEGLGWPDAARHYYELAVQLAQNPDSACHAPAASRCGGVQLPEQALARLAKLRQR